MSKRFKAPVTRKVELPPWKNVRLLAAKIRIALSSEQLPDTTRQPTTAVAAETRTKGVPRDVDLEVAPARRVQLLVQARTDLVEDAALRDRVPIGVDEIVRLVEERVVEALVHAALDVDQVARLGRVQLRERGLEGG